MNLKESDKCHFESRLVPINDPDLKVEWYKDGKLLRAGHKFKPMYDFGYVALDILYTYPEDSGVYLCKATNNYGEDVTQAEIKCYPKDSVIEESQLPEGIDTVQKMEAMEESWQKPVGDRIEDEQEQIVPIFDLVPEPVQCEEGETAKFLVKVAGYPRPRVTWWVNSSIAVNGARYKLHYDGMLYSLEMPKAREYDSGTVKVVARNVLGEAECSTTLRVIPKEDWRSALKAAPRSTVQVELDKHKNVELRSMELDEKLKKPKATVSELRAFERDAQDRARLKKDEEVIQAYQNINWQHATMAHQKSTAELREHSPLLDKESIVHVERAKAMLQIASDYRDEESHKQFHHSKPIEKQPPTFLIPLQPVVVRESESMM